MRTARVNLRKMDLSSFKFTVVFPTNSITARNLREMFAEKWDSMLDQRQKLIFPRVAVLDCWKFRGIIWDMDLREPLMSCKQNRLGPGGIDCYNFFSSLQLRKRIDFSRFKTHEERGFCRRDLRKLNQLGAVIYSVSAEKITRVNSVSNFIARNWIFLFIMSRNSDLIMPRKRDAISGRPGLALTTSTAINNSNKITDDD